MKRNLKQIVFLFSAIAALFLWPAEAFAITSINLPTGDATYRALDRLAALGIIDTYIKGQRPVTKSEAARLVLEAENNFSRLNRPFDKIAANRIIKYYKRQLDADIKQLQKDSEAKFWNAAPIEKLTFDFTSLGRPVRNIPFYGSRPTGAILHPLAAYNGGRHTQTGKNFSFETTHWISTPVFAAFAQPRFQFQASDTPVDEDKIFVQKLYAKIGVGNFELEAGRDELTFGQSEFGGLLFSTNTRPFDIVKFSTPYPFELPSFLNAAGPAKFSAFVASLGPDYGYKNAKFTGGKLSIAPTKYFEAGVAYSLIAGGGGGVSNRMLNFDAKITLPPVSAAELYFEVMAENEDFADRTSLNAGVYFPVIGRINNMALRAEYFHTPSVNAKAGTWTAGLTLNNELMGSPLGPDGDGIYLTYYYDLGLKSRARLGFAYERRGKNSTEERYRPSIGVAFPIGGHLKTDFGFGYEKSQNFANVKGQNRDSFVFNMNLALAFL